MTQTANCEPRACKVCGRRDGAFRRRQKGDASWTTGTCLDCERASHAVQARKWRKTVAGVASKAAYTAKYFGPKLGYKAMDFPESMLRKYVAIAVKECAICGSTGSRLALDHDHVTGAFRGYLCVRCNTSLERFERVGGFAVRAEAYLRGVL